MNQDQGRYNYPPDLLADIKDLRRRIGVLERYRRTAKMAKVRTTHSSAKTGTTLQNDDVLALTIQGIPTNYEFACWIQYRADATNNGKVAIATSISGTGVVEVHYSIDYISTAGATTFEYVLTDGTLRSVSVDGAGSVGGTGFTGTRPLFMKGQVFVPVDVNSFTMTVQTAENSGTGTGFEIRAGSYMWLEPHAIV